MRVFLHNYCLDKNFIYLFLFLSLFFDSYRFFAIGNRDITLWYVFAFVLITFSLFFEKKIYSFVKTNIVAWLIIIYMIINYCLLGQNEQNSLFIGIFCLLFFIASYRKTTHYNFFKIVNFFQVGMNFFAIYGIYQFIANIFGAPLSNLWMDGFMVDGYNWGNNIVIGGHVFRRANAIFREPSYFSQLLAINMLIYCILLLSGRFSNKKEIKFLSWTILNGLALGLSFSGTGALIFILGLLCFPFFYTPYETRHFFKKIVPTFVFLFAVLIYLYISSSPLFNYFVGRLSEFDYTNIQSISGYLRMVLPYQAAYDVLLSSNSFFGEGIGNAKFLVLSENMRPVGNSVQPIFARTIVEEGFIGFCLLVCFFYQLLKKAKENSNLFYSAIFLGTFFMSFMHGTWSSEMFWLFLGILNVDFSDKYLVK